MLPMTHGKTRTSNAIKNWNAVANAATWCYAGHCPVGGAAYASWLQTQSWAKIRRGKCKKKMYRKTKKI